MEQTIKHYYMYINIQELQEYNYQQHNMIIDCPLLWRLLNS